MTVKTAQVCVIIAARDAAATIGAAVCSALAEPEVAEVVLVDDASADGTAQTARDTAQGDGRLNIISQPVNTGPAAARNAAIAASRAPFLAILDGDDVILPGRFRALLDAGSWDLIADNILFCAEAENGMLEVPEGRVAAIAEEPLSLAAFVAGNIAEGPQQRGELGFLKPMIRRDFLTRHGLAYAPEMRLGEDFDLYTRALLAGARFGVTRQIGYVARVRANSLSARHTTADLKALLAACDHHVAAAPSEPVLRRHRRQCLHRYLLRAFLDAKSEAGLGAAVRLALNPPSNLAPIVRGIARDKLAALRPAAALSPVGRTLLPQ